MDDLLESPHSALLKQKAIMFFLLQIKIGLFIDPSFINDEIWTKTA